MVRTITRSYETYEDARNVVARLEEAGIASSAISLLGRQQGGDDRTGEGAGLGGLVGGAAGLLAGLGIIAVPGIGPVVAVGWLASTAAGAAVGVLAGGLVGALMDSGINERDANYYAETVRRGGSIVSVRTPDERAAAVEAIMDAGMPIDSDERRAAYEREGWTQFDANAAPYHRKNI